jgi:hypothetical protein
MSRLPFLGTLWPSQFHRTSKCHAATRTLEFKYVTSCKMHPFWGQILSELYHSRCILKVKTVATWKYKSFSLVTALSDTMAWEKSFSIKMTRISTCFWSSTRRKASIYSKFFSNMYLYYIYWYAKYKVVCTKPQLKNHVCPKEHQCPKERQYTVDYPIPFAQCKVIQRWWDSPVFLLFSSLSCRPSSRKLWITVSPPAIQLPQPYAWTPCASHHSACSFASAGTQFHHDNSNTSTKTTRAMKSPWKNSRTRLFPHFWPITSEFVQPVFSQDIKDGQSRRFRVILDVIQDAIRMAVNPPLNRGKGELLSNHWITSWGDSRSWITIHSTRFTLLKVLISK